MMKNKNNQKKLTRRNLIRLVVLIGLSVGSLAIPKVIGVAGNTVGHFHKRPNIVIILADDQRFDEIGCMGHPFAKTPAIDRLAVEGTLFTNAVVSTPLCGPSRACLFTGNFAHTHRLRNHGDKVPQPAPPMPVPCFPALLRDAGYSTALFGKFHDGESSYGNPGFTHFEPSRNPYIDPDFLIDGNWVKHKGHVDQLITEKADSWIRDNYKGSPFLAVLSHLAPHMPLVPPKEYENLYEQYTPLRRPNVNDVSGQGKATRIKDAQRWFRSMRQTGNIPAWTWPAPFSDEQLRDRMRLNQVLDDSVARIYKTLEDIGQLDNTVFIYHSDNGYYLGEHGLSEKYYPYEEGLRVPLIVRYPAVSVPGQQIDKPVDTIDIAPTLLDIAGVDVPKSVDGVSLNSLLKGDGKVTWRDATFHEFFFHEGVNPYPVWQAVRTREWKYIRFDKPFDEELYDLKKDPYEITNLAANPNYKQILKENRELLDKLALQTKGKAIVIKRKIAQ